MLLLHPGRPLTAADVEKKTEEESAAKTAAKLRKQLCIPELDPDALPSSQTQKMLNLTRINLLRLETLLL